jgi:hypothetical protein
MKVHLHAEQFDGHLHAACGRLEAQEAPSEYVKGEEEFSRLARWERCNHCTRINWPRGGDPITRTE